MKNASDIMTKEVITVSLETTVQELAQLFSTHGISGAPVIASDASDMMPSVIAIAAAVSRWSPVIMIGRMPAERHC